MEAFHTKYRPRTFEDVVDQPSIVKILTRQLETNQLSHAYLFAGPSGCGKTTLAYLLAKNADAELIEIDVASINSVDSSREIVKSAGERSVTHKRKAYLLDECQMYSNAAWQPYLKEIENPSEYTIFIFCTTDPQKVPQTILTRVQRFNLNRVSNAGIQHRLCYICEKEGLSNYEEGTAYIARISNGSPRQAISLLEKCAGYSNSITLQNVLDAVGNYSYSIFFKLINACIDGSEQGALSALNDIFMSGVEVKLFVDQFISFCLDINKFAIFKDCSLTQLPDALLDDISKCVNFDNAPGYYQYVLGRLLELKNMLKTDSNPRDTTEIVFLQITRCL